jgi:hypothetical protein
LSTGSSHGVSFEIDLIKRDPEGKNEPLLDEKGLKEVTLQKTWLSSSRSTSAGIGTLLFLEVGG